MWVKGTGVAGAPTPKPAAFSADGLGRLLSPGSEGSVSTILQVCEHSLIPPLRPVQTLRQSRRVVGAEAHLLTSQGHHPESQLFCSLNGFALPGAPPPSSLSELKTNSKRLCCHHVATTHLLAKAGKSGLLIPRTLKEEEKHLDNYLQQILYIYKLIYILYKKYMEISMKDNTKMKKVT